MSASGITAITREIPYSGKCYLVLERYDAKSFFTEINKSVNAARKAGARLLYFSSRDRVFAQEADFRCGEYEFRFYSDFDVLEKVLTPEQGPAYRMKPLSPDNAPLYIALKNESFVEVPNAVTTDDEEIRRILGGPYEAGFLMVGGEPQGTYELDFSAAVPEIAAVSIRPSHRGAGRGHMAMHTLEQYLFSRGACAAQLLVASANTRACTLYHARGYRRARHISRWYSVNRAVGESWPLDLSR